MNYTNKLFIIIVATSSLILVAYDETVLQCIERNKREQQYALEREQAQKSTIIWAGAIGAVAGSAIGYWLGLSDTDSENTYEDINFDAYQHEYLSPKALQVKEKLDRLSKYGQNFQTSDDYCAGVVPTISEQAIINNLYKLGFQLHQIEGDFYNKLAREHKVLSDAGYSIWWHSLKVLENQKNIYLKNSNQLIKYFNYHQDFIYACQIINFYDKLPLYAYAVPAWVQNQYYNHPYPLIYFMQNLKYDRQKLMDLQKYSGHYTAQKVYTTQCMLDNVVDIIYNSYAYQQEFIQQRQDKLLEECNRVEQERLEIIKKQVRALEEANRIAVEKNRIEQEKNQNYRDDY